MKHCEVCGSSENIYGKNGKYAMDLCNKHRSQMEYHGKILNRTTRQPNDFIVNGDILEIVIYNNKSEESCRALVNMMHYNKVIGYKWCIDGNGYVMSKSNISIKLHRLITNAPKDMIVDHINHDTLDNRDVNLRICTKQENCCNQVICSRNTSGHKGISWKSRNNKWQVQISCKGKVIYLGLFTDINDAIAARKEAEVKYHGKFAYTG